MIQTVLETVKKEKLGITLAHEHLLIDLSKFVEIAPPEAKPYMYEKVRLDNQWRIYTDPYEIIDNVILDSEEDALLELMLFKEAGGETIVDVTPHNVGRNPNALKRLSEKSGLNIIMGCGNYIDGAINDIDRGKTVKEIANEIINDLTIGIDGVKAGVIGEIGTSATITPFEDKSLESAGIAAFETGNAVHVHTSLYEENGLYVIDKLSKLGVQPEKIAINHIDVVLRYDYLKKLLDKGVYIEFDNFGKEYFIPKRENGALKGRFAYDLERARIIKQLVNEGYVSQILITNDICLKNMLCKYGGNGYSHVLRTVKSMLLDCGITESDYNNMLKNNPATFLDNK